jgi:phosphoribosylformimino-5-aminoimidazole carboxamide ribotide isomerase
MHVFPAIDLLDGKVVRLTRGDYNAVKVYNQDPVAQALEFANAGAAWLHVVDLDGARNGTPAHSDIIHKIIAKTGLKVEVGGGIRTLESLSELAAAGASRVVLGTALVSNPEFAQAAVERFGDIVCAGVDARDGLVAIAGWRKNSGVCALELVAELANIGIRHLVYTDIARDGMQSGISVEDYTKVAAAAGFAVTASGGISSLQDLRDLAALGDNVVEAVIVGRAIYEEAFTLSDALSLVSGIEPSAPSATGATPATGDNAGNHLSPVSGG